MSRITLKTKHASFDAISLRAANPTQGILFASGSGGNPERHLTLLTSLVERGCTVIAPCFERITSPTPTPEDLLPRVEVLVAALDLICESNLPVAGIGHSIGAALLVGLVGGQMWMRSGQRLPVTQDARIKKLVLFTPPTGFFQAPGALASFHTPAQIWSGSRDTITPPEQVKMLKTGQPMGTPLDFRIADGAGHFSFMNSLPPGINDPMANREEFLTRLAEETYRFVVT